MMTCVKIKTQSIIKFTWNLKDILIVKNRKKAGLLKLSDVNTNYSIAVIKTSVDGTRASEK